MTRRKAHHSSSSHTAGRTPKKMKAQGSDFFKNLDRTVRAIDKGVRIGKHIHDNYFKQHNTKYKTRQRQQALVQISQHNDVSSQKFKLILRKRPLRGSKDKIKYVENMEFIFNGAEGIQGVFAPRCFFSTQSFVGPTSNSRNTQNQMGVTWFQMNPDAKSTGSSYVTAGTTTDSRINILKAHHDMEFVNMENLATTVWVYFFVCSKNTSKTPLQIWSDAITNQSQGQSNLVPSIVTTSNVAVTGATSINVVGNFPNDAMMKKYWRLLTCKKFVLQGGDTHKLEYEMYVNKQVLYSEINEAANADGALYYRGLSVFPLIITKGSLAGISDPQGPTEVTYGKTKVGCVMSNKYTLSVPKEPPSAPIVIGKYDLVVGSHTEKIINDVDVSDNVNMSL